MQTVDIIVIGGGSAGMAAALSAKEQGIDSVLLLERDVELGGILQQCIHNGFGLQVFHEELSGPTFAQRLIDEMKAKDIAYRLQTTVLSIGADKTVTYVNPKEGYVTIQARAIILACGCFERSRGAISIPGTRPKGIYTAGTAQRYLNMENVLVGKRVFILGSGDIGLIMARRMTLEGAEVLGVAEIMPYSNGLMRNIVQCLEDFSIPLYLSHTIIDIQGKEQVEKVVIAKVDADRQVIKGTEKAFAVDTVLLSVGLIPDVNLAKGVGIQIDPFTKGAIVNDHLETTVKGIYACGNGLHVHDLVDFVTLEAKQAGCFAAQDLQETSCEQEMIKVVAAEGLQYVLPQRLNIKSREPVVFSFRVRQPHKRCVIECLDQDEVICTQQMRYALPAEMQRLTLRPEQLQKIHANVRIRVRDL